MPCATDPLLQRLNCRIFLPVSGNQREEYVSHCLLALWIRDWVKNYNSLDFIKHFTYTTSLCSSLVRSIPTLKIRKLRQEWTMHSMSDQGQSQDSNHGPARAAIKKCHKLCDLNNRNLFLHNSGGQESQTKVGQGQVRYCFLACGWPPSHCVLTPPFLGAYVFWCIFPAQWN